MVGRGTIVVDDLVAHVTPAEAVVAEGLELAGWVEKFSRVKGWRLRWFRFNESSGNLEYYRFDGSAKEREALGMAPPPQAMLSIDGVIDLHYVAEVSLKPGEDRRLNIDAGPKRKFKLRFPSDPIGKHWCEQLLVWRDHHEQKRVVSSQSTFVSARSAGF